MNGRRISGLRTKILSNGNWPGNPDSRDYFNELHRKVGSKREDVWTWFDLLDLDDHISFGGKA